MHRIVDSLPTKRTTTRSSGNVSLRVHWGPLRHTSVGDPMSKYGGGGHHGAGTCILPADKAAEAIEEILYELQANG